MLKKFNKQMKDQHRDTILPAKRKPFLPSIQHYSRARAHVVVNMLKTQMIPISITIWLGLAAT